MYINIVIIRGIDGMVNELPVFVIHGSQIRHLEVIQKPPPSQQQQPLPQSPAPPSIQQQQQQHPSQTPPPKPQANQFVDPAIISVSNKKKKRTIYLFDYYNKLNFFYDIIR